jgi:hypothetical protein
VPSARTTGSLQARARAALAARLRELVPAGRLHPGGEHALALEDALAAGDPAWVLGHLERGAKGELRPRADGAVPGFAAWSSTALVASAFAPLRGELPGLVLEARLHIPHGGGTPNLDARWDGVGVEAKLTEHLAPRAARAWRPAYRRPAMRDALEGGWRATFDALLDGTWAPRFLDAGQLVRHALSLHRARDTELRYVFWQPGGAHPELAQHRAELDELLERVGAARPRLRALTWAEQWAGWPHAPVLRERYDLDVR